MGIFENEVEAAESGEAEPADERDGCGGHGVVLNDFDEDGGAFEAPGAADVGCDDAEDLALPAGDGEICVMALDELLNADLTRAACEPRDDVIRVVLDSSFFGGAQESQGRVEFSPDADGLFFRGDNFDAFSAGGAVSLEDGGKRMLRKPGAQGREIGHDLGGGGQDAFLLRGGEEGGTGGKGGEGCRVAERALQERTDGAGGRGIHLVCLVEQLVQITCRGIVRRNNEAGLRGADGRQNGAQGTERPEAVMRGYAASKRSGMARGAEQLNPEARLMEGDGKARCRVPTARSKEEDPRLSEKTCRRCRTGLVLVDGADARRYRFDGHCKNYRSSFKNRVQENRGRGPGPTAGPSQWAEHDVTNFRVQFRGQPQAATAGGGIWVDWNRSCRRESAEHR